MLHARADRPRPKWRGRVRVFTIDVANTVFIVCLAVGGVLLLVTVLLDDILGGVLDSLGLDFDLGGVSLMPLLLAFVAMFGVGGLIGTEALGLDTGRASLLGGAFGILGAGLVYALFSILRRAEAPDAFSLSDLVGRSGRVSVGIPAGRNGSVLISYEGSSHDLRATSSVDVPPGTVVSVTDVVGGTLIVQPLVPASEGESNA
jgi:membrane protein implicated in regulation of membrane protease activity